MLNDNVWKWLVKRECLWLLPKSWDASCNVVIESYLLTYFLLLLISLRSARGSLLSVFDSCLSVCLSTEREKLLLFQNWDFWGDDRPLECPQNFGSRVLIIAPKVLVFVCHVLTWQVNANSCHCVQFTDRFSYSKLWGLLGYFWFVFKWSESCCCWHAVFCHQTSVARKITFWKFVICLPVSLHPLIEKACTY